ncbi:tail fiber domain-containing protein [Chryseobacterium sp. MEBOG06]|uniref:tail fiber domain-containing protein n=1 Tax=Chryseobacterium sp. MEBOG06 TaxID=2879938 RepID=UPI001F32276B|nr:tail fiber domain-containing protein [Chryseobacterium sp. MEBOG06]UKB86155.1 tail fiber domain-containing protein [Chryseobacterium sp. MEBOG06]
MKKCTLLLLFLFFENNFQAQVGINTTTPNASSVLDLVGSNKGLLIPRIALTGSSDTSTVPSPANSLMIYNSAAANGVVPGYYYWSTNAGRWAKVLDDLTPIIMTGWSLTGNSGMVNGINFIGTSDNVDVIFKRNNIVSGVLNTTNTIFGVNSLTANTIGLNNTAVGVNNLISNTTGSMNTAIGSEVLSSNKSGIQNTGYGYRALYSNLDGNNNVANGYFSLYAAKSTISNVGIGASSLRELISGDENVGVGGDTYRMLPGGRGNTAIGGSAGYSLNTVNNYNTFIGFRAAAGLVSGKSNTIIGANVSGLPASLSNNVIIADGDGNRRINIDQNGNIGIGTNTPKFPLDIRLKTSAWPLPVSSITYYGISPDSGSFDGMLTTYSNYTNDIGAFNANTSIYADGNIISVGKLSVAQTSLFSDQRIKNIIGKSDNVKDLAILKKLSITDYQMKDKALYGTQEFKKVIAQEVEKVYPQAVSKSGVKAFIPNIYQLAKQNGAVFMFEKAVDIAKADKFLKIYDETGEIILEIKSSTPNSITVDLADKKLKGKLFVYGTEVSDIRTVDYDALSMLNISATQALVKKIEALESENETLKKSNIEMQHKQVRFEERLKKLESSFTR